MAKVFRFECASMSEEGLFYQIVVSDQLIRCDCGGSEIWCSHIEATLVEGERAMVRSEHWRSADQAMKIAVGRLQAPPGWKASWRKLLKWRGISSGRVFTPSTVGQSGLPVVCFTGTMPSPRKQLAAQAEAFGWEVVDNPHSRTAVLVAADLAGTSNKLQFARKHAIPILTLDEWDAMRLDGIFPDK